MVSLRSMAQCAGVSGNFSLLQNFFGYRHGQPRFSINGNGLPVSTLHQVKALQGKHINLDIILVGGDAFLPDHLYAIDYSLYKTREIYATVGLGIGRISYSLITVAEADGLHQVSDDKDTKKLRRKYRGPHDDALDVFIVLDFNLEEDGVNLLGIARIDVSDNKDAYHADGVVMGVRYGGGSDLGAVFMGPVLAHEVGHCLGLEHSETPGNLMFAAWSGLSLTLDQGQTMLEHEFVQPGC